MRPFTDSTRLAVTIATVAAAVICLSANAALAATNYIYDPVGRLTVVIYDNGVCVAYSYDADGNRTASNIATSATGSLTWGSGVWGCTTWSP